MLHTLHNICMQKEGRIVPGQCCFFMSALGLSYMPVSGKEEVAFWGRSNVGKSSLLNALMGRSALARTSKSPGRTQAIHFYSVSDLLFFVDLPGYGYAEVPMALQKKWDRLIGEYFQMRRPLRMIYVLIDGRRGLQPADHIALTFLKRMDAQHQCVVTKIDKATTLQKQSTLQEISSVGASMRFVTSSHTKEGIDVFRSALEQGVF